MRRNMRVNRGKDDVNMKIVKYSIVGVIIFIALLYGIIMYSKKLNNEVREGTLTSEQISNILNKNQIDESESASSQIGKKVNEIDNELVENTLIQENIEETDTLKNNTLTTNKISENTLKKQNENEKVKSINAEAKKEEKNVVELNFQKPVEGDIIKDFSIDNLVYSETLQEWVTHAGIDIKADKTTVVKSAEAGIVKSIKNDPRYGLTIIVEHANGFETVYSNLLTTEFVVEGEKVDKGQSLGTVGNSAAFEIADEPHLHFEVLKDSQNVDPNIYIK